MSNRLNCFINIIIKCSIAFCNFFIYIITKITIEIIINDFFFFNNLINNWYIKFFGIGIFSITGVIIASGGGGSGGWGNRYENDGIGGRPGYPATNWPSGIGNYGGNGSSPGLATNNTGTSLINTTGQFTLSPAA